MKIDAYAKVLLGAILMLPALGVVLGMFFESLSGGAAGDRVVEHGLLASLSLVGILVLVSAVAAVARISARVDMLEAKIRNAVSAIDGLERRMRAVPRAMRGRGPADGAVGRPTGELGGGSLEWPSLTGWPGADDGKAVVAEFRRGGASQ